MSVRSGQSITVEFVTSSFSTGAATNADSLPTATLVVNGADNGATVTVSNVDTGRYKAALTLPTLTVGDTVELAVSATVGGVAGKNVVWRETFDILLGDPTAATGASSIANEIAALPQTSAAIAGTVWTNPTRTLTTGGNQAIADTVLRRQQVNVEGSSSGDALSLHSLYGMIQQAQKSNVSGTSMTVFQTDGVTTLGTLTLIVSAGASPVTGVS